LKKDKARLVHFEEKANGVLWQGDFPEVKLVLKEITIPERYGKEYSVLTANHRFLFIYKANSSQVFKAEV
jgi:hypothetical protein